MIKIYPEILKNKSFCYETSTAVYFAMKGFDVLSCPWRKVKSAQQQVDDMLKFRKQSTPEMVNRFQGVIETVWSGTREFMKTYHSNELKENSSVAVLKTIFPK